MKNATQLLILILVCFAGEAFAQNKGRFYGSLQAGPKLSVSNSYLEFGNSTNVKSGRQLGLLLGYEFQNQRLIVETGAIQSLHYVDINFELYQNSRNFEEYSSFHTKQFPLRLKVALNNPDDKVVLRTITGVTFIHPLYWKSPNSFNTNEMDENQVRILNYKGDWDERFGFYGDQSLSNSRLRPSWGAEVGLEAEAKLTDRLRLVANVIYQNGFRTVFNKTYAFNYDYRGADTENPWQYVVASSKAEALNFNAGIVYSFGK